MTNIKLLALDLDGTFFYEDTNVTEENIKAIKRMQNEGVMIVVVSGRNIHDEFDFMNEIEIPYFVGSNGAIIKNREKNEIIYHEYMDNNEANQLVKYFEDMGLYTYATCEDGILQANMNVTDYLKDAWPFISYSDFIDMSLSSYLMNYHKNIEKVGTLLERAEQVEIALREKEKFTQLEIVQSNTLCVEAYSKNTSKGTALRWLLNELNIPKEKVMAIGDSDSDVTMFKEAGLSIAMENGTKQAKKVADYTTLSNKENGVAYIINALLDKND